MQGLERKIKFLINEKKHVIFQTGNPYNRLLSQYMVKNQFKMVKRIILDRVLTFKLLLYLTELMLYRDKHLAKDKTNLL